MSEDAVKSIAAVIVQTAVMDWKALEKAGQESIYYEREDYEINRTELIQFFNSTWMDILMDILELDADKILVKLLGDNFGGNVGEKQIRVR